MGSGGEEVALQISNYKIFFADNRSEKSVKLENLRNLLEYRILLLYRGGCEITLFDIGQRLRRAKNFNEPHKPGREYD